MALLCFSRRLVLFLRRTTTQLVRAMLLTGGVVLPQDLPPSSKPPGVTVPECKWQKSRYIRSIPDYPHRHSVEEVRQGMPNSAPPMMGALPDAYLYSIRVRNEGPKVIKSMSWDYVFNAADYGELGRLLIPAGVRMECEPYPARRTV